MRHWNYREMEAFDFEVLGLAMGGLRTVYNYIQYRQTGVLIFSAYENEMYFVKLTLQQLEGFKNGEFGLSFDGHSKTTITGWPVLQCKKMSIARIESKPAMKKALKKAETYK